MSDRYRFLILAVVVVSFVALLPGSVSAAPAAGQGVRIADDRVRLWNEGVDHFIAQRSEFTPDQAQLIEDAYAFGDQIAGLREDGVAQAMFARRATRFMERAREVFTNKELGQLFSSMGPAQVWFTLLAGATPYCNCTGSGDCTFGSGGPTGTCQGGCVSWDGDDGRRRDGVCNAAAAD